MTCYEPRSNRNQCFGGVLFFVYRGRHYQYGFWFSGRTRGHSIAASEVCAAIPVYENYVLSDGSATHLLRNCSSLNGQRLHQVLLRALEHHESHVSTQPSAIRGTNWVDKGR